MAKKKSLKVSIVVPVYNADLYLEECLKSLVNQTLQDIEIICVNDNSKDKSLKILQKYARSDNRVKIINLKETAGQSKARNVALEVCCGEYIGFVDADDFVDLDMYEKMYNKAQKSDIVMCQAKVFDDKVQTYRDDEYFALSCFDENFSEEPFAPEDTKDFITDINVSVWNKIYRRDFLEKIKVKFQEGYIYEDFLYFYEVYTKAKKAVLLKEFLYTYRINSVNSTMTKTDKNVKDRIDMVSSAYAVLREQKYFPEIKSKVVSSIIHDIFYRFLIIDTRYQKEYFFKMQKFFRTIETKDIDDTLIKSRYYSHFCEIKKSSYDEIIKYFFNQETQGSAYVEHAKNILEREYAELENRKRENAKSREIQDFEIKQRLAEIKKEKEQQLGQIEQLKKICEKERAENIKEQNSVKKSKAELDRLWKELEKEKEAQSSEIKAQWVEFEKEKEAQSLEIKAQWAEFEKKKTEKIAELEELQTKILQEARKSAEEFNKQKQENIKDFARQKADIAEAWSKLEEEKRKNQNELEILKEKILQDEKVRWSEFEQKAKQKNEEILIQHTNLDSEWKKLEEERKEQNKLLDKEWKKIEEEKTTQQAELETAWDKFKRDTKSRKYELDSLQEKILADEKTRWNEFEKETKLKMSELQKKEATFHQESEQRQLNLNKLEEELYKKNKAREEELKKAEAELEKAWEKFKLDNLQREKELDKKQSEILSDEKDRWKRYELQVADLEYQKGEFEKEKEVQNSEIKAQWADFEKEKEVRYSEIKRLWSEFEREKEIQKAEIKAQWSDFEKEKEVRYSEIKRLWSEFEREKGKQSEEIQRMRMDAEDEKQRQEADLESQRELQQIENDRQRKKNKLVVEKTKSILSGKFIREIEREKTKLIKEYAEEVSKQKEYYAELVQEQLKNQEENYKKIKEFKEAAKGEIMPRPKVSIILPVYNVAPYLRQSLDSVIAQTLDDIEIICVDDGSTDESGKILDEYKEKDNRIKVIHKKNAGTGAARNDGLKVATGECIGFVDPDDWILPNMYERLYNILQDKNLDIVMFTPDVFNDKTQKHEGFLYFQDSNFPKILDEKIFSKDDISPFLYPMCVWNKLYRKKLFDENNIDFAEGLDFEDHKVIFKSLFTAKRIYFIREKLYVYRHSRQGSILSDNDTRMFDHIKIYDIVENILKETGNWESFHQDFLRYKVHNILYYYTMIKPQYKEEYYKKMVKSLQSTQMSEREYEILTKDYPDLKQIMEDTLSNKIKKAVKKILKK